jgi:hypothetical protein
MRDRAGTSIKRLRSDLQRSLFPPAPADAIRFGRWEGALVLVSFLLLAGALQFLRAGPTDSPKALFAEDGTEFLAGALNHGLLDSLFFVPLAVLRAVAIVDRRDALVVGAFGLALAIQLPVTVFNDQHVSDPNWTHHILTSLLQRVVDGAALGLELGGHAWAAWGWPFLIAISLAVAAALLALGSRAPRGRLLALMAVGTGFAMFVGSEFQRALGDTLVWPQGSFSSLGARYAMIPALLLASAALVLADARSPSRGRPSWAAMATAAVLLTALVTSFGGDAHRQMPSWPQSLREGAVDCRAGAAADATVFITPEGWSMGVPCERLESEYAAAPDG